MSQATSENSRAADNDTMAVRARRTKPQLDIVSPHPAAEVLPPSVAVEAGVLPKAGPGGTSILPTSTAGPAPSFEQLPVGSITIPADRLRQADPAKVEAYAHSFGIVGQMQPIRVERGPDGGLVLVAGLHRLLAAKRAGLVTIDALVSAAQGADERRLTEILENLMRAELVALDRAVALSELKAIHERKYPQTRKGGDRKSQAAVSVKKNQGEILSFRSDLAEKIGLGVRSIEIAIQIANGLGSTIRARLQGTWIADHQAGLRDLSVLEEALQHQVLDLLLSTPPGASNMVEAMQIVDGKRPETMAEKFFDRAGGNLERLTPEARRPFWTKYADEIIPVLKAEGLI